MMLCQHDKPIPCEDGGWDMFSSRLQNEQTDNLARAFLALQSMEDCYRLFEDLFTIREIQDLSQRLEVARMLRDGHTYDDIVERIGEIFFYGAGCTKEKAPVVATAMRTVMNNKARINVLSDMLGAARALCADRPGIVCILGTGSNSCYYDGEDIVDNVSPLGYILGDEGSGAVLGKHFLNALFKGVLPVSMLDDYLQSVGMSYSDIIDRIYRQPMANRFLASTSLFINKHLDSELLQQIVIDNFRQFVRRNIQPYQRPDLPLHSIGSIAWHYRELLQEAVTAEGYILGTVSKSPMKGLLLYHTQVS